MVENRLKEVIKEQNIRSISELMLKTGLSRNALNKLWHDQDIETVKLATLFQVCDALEVELNDLIRYRPKDRRD